MDTLGLGAIPATVATVRMVEHKGFTQGAVVLVIVLEIGTEHNVIIVI